MLTKDAPGMWLAFDLGTSGVKAAALDNDGKIVRSAAERYPTHTANGGGVEQEVSDWWRALVAAARLADGEVTEIVLTGQMQDLIQAIFAFLPHGRSNATRRGPRQFSFGDARSSGT